ncbi:MAG: hypothetical protein R3B51_14480 [Thermodesulfobacteriota bacterium]
MGKEPGSISSSGRQHSADVANPRRHHPAAVDPPEWLDEYTGYYVRLTDSDGRDFFFQTLRDPFRSEAETYGDDETSPLDYAILKEPEVEFSIPFHRASSSRSKS